MALYTPNLAAHVPTDMDWEGGTYAQGAVAHPSMLFAGRDDHGLSRAPIEVPGDLLCPPAWMVAIRYCKTWQLTAEIVAAGLTHTIDQTISGRASWAEAIDYGDSPNYDEVVKDEATDNAIRIWTYVTGVPSYQLNGSWWGGYFFLIVATDLTPETGGSASISEGFTGDLSDVVATINGQVIPLYYAPGETIPITGTITLNPVDYLTVE